MSMERPLENTPDEALAETRRVCLKMLERAESQNTIAFGGPKAVQQRLDEIDAEMAAR